MLNCRKTILLFATLALLMLPQTAGFAQDTQECQSPSDMVALAKATGVNYKTDLTGPGLKAFFTVYLETTQGSATDEEVLALTSQIEQIGIASREETSVGFIVVYVKGCATKVVQVPKDLLDYVMKQVERLAGANSNGS